MSSEKQARQAQLILDYQEREHSQNRATQEKEVYIMNLLEKHHKELVHLEDMVTKERLRASVAEAKLARLEVGKEDE